MESPHECGIKPPGSISHGVYNELVVTGILPVVWLLHWSNLFYCNAAVLEVAGRHVCTCTVLEKTHTEFPSYSDQLQTLFMMITELRYLIMEFVRD